MTSHAAIAVTRPVACEVCGGPCTSPHRLGPVPENYPFLDPETIRMINAAQSPEPVTPDAPADVDERGRLRRENTMAHRESRPVATENRC